MNPESSGMILVVGKVVLLYFSTVVQLPILNDENQKGYRNFNDGTRASKIPENILMACLSRVKC